jgi:hypothetical protein
MTGHIYTEAIQPEDGRAFLYAIVGPAADGGGPTFDAAYKLVHLDAWDNPVIEGATIEEARLALWEMMEETADV